MTRTQARRLVDYCNFDRWTHPQSDEAAIQRLLPLEYSDFDIVGFFTIKSKEQWNRLQDVICGEQVKQ